MKKKTSILATLAAIAIVAMLIGTTQINEITAEEKEGYKYANDITVKTVFHFENGKGDEVIEFQVFDQKKGFDRESQAPRFELQGVIDADRPYLYEATDVTYEKGSRLFQHGYSNFDVDVSLMKGDIPIRTFSYGKCMIQDYKVETLFDKEEAWMGKGFVVIDKFTLDCDGLYPNNPLMDYMNKVDEVESISTMDLIVEQQALAKLRSQN